MGRIDATGHQRNDQAWRGEKNENDRTDQRLFVLIELLAEISSIAVFLSKEQLLSGEAADDEDGRGQIDDERHEEVSNKNHCIVVFPGGRGIVGDAPVLVKAFSVVDQFSKDELMR